MINTGPSAMPSGAMRNSRPRGMSTRPPTLSGKIGAQKPIMGSPMGGMSPKPMGGISPNPMGNGGIQRSNIPGLIDNNPMERQAHMPMGGGINTGPSGNGMINNSIPNPTGNTGINGGMMDPRRKPMMPSATPNISGMGNPNAFGMGGMTMPGLQELWQNYNRMMGLG